MFRDPPQTLKSIPVSISMDRQIEPLFHTNTDVNTKGPAETQINVMLPVNFSLASSDRMNSSSGELVSRDHRLELAWCQHDKGAVVVT